MSEFEFESKNVSPFRLVVPEGVFLPTHTSTLCVEAALKKIPPNSSILDLGCGSGVVSIAIAKNLALKAPVFASDLSILAVETARQNMSLHSLYCEVRQGSLFEPWLKHRFDYIVDDVSGIAEDVANLSPWFAENIPCKSGRDGTDLTCEVISEASNYLNRGGGLFFPTISLSAERKIVEFAEKNFQHVNKVASQKWFLPVEMKDYLPLMIKMKEEGLISFEERFGAVMCETSVYFCVSD